MEGLPVEVLVVIFGFLESRQVMCGLGRVCRRFRETVKRVRMWWS